MAGCMENGTIMADFIIINILKKDGGWTWFSGAAIED
jgi:hypothetical protein